MQRNAFILRLAGLALLMQCGLAVAARPAELEQAPDISGVGWVEKPGDTLPLDLSFTNERGKHITLRELVMPGKPVVLNLGYFGCPRLCGLVMNGMTAAMKETSLLPGRDYVVLSISIDANETYKLAAAKKQHALHELGKSEAGAGWHFLTGSEANIKAITDAAGYRFQWVDSAGQFAHPAGIIVVTPDGMISRYLHGKDFAGNTFRLSLVEASEGKIGNVFDQLMLICFEYDKDKHKYTMAAVGLMRLGGASTITILAILAFFAFRWERKRRRASMSS